MCQLLAINADTPTSISFTFRKFCQRGGCGDVHKDGWGLCFYEGGGGIRSFYDTAACCRSPLAAFLKDNFSPKTSNMVAHIRYMTRGDVSIENLHPFVRELWGITFCFAHNGDVPLFSHIQKNRHILLGKASADNLVYHEVGDTDSEAVFCAILNALRAEFHDELPTLHQLHDFLAQICEEIVTHKDVIFNFILSCGPNTLFAYSWPGRKPPSTTWNGLYYLVRQEVSPSIATVTAAMPSTPSVHSLKLEDEDYEIDYHFPPLTTSKNDENTTTINNPPEHLNRIAIVATKPLTDEVGWIEMKPRELLMFDRGVPYSTSTELDTIDCEGRGLLSKCFPKAACLVCKASSRTPIH
uniref:Glutamine amidotransferase type-2 domain-containing protein n=1 Tax=Amphora coffeiformis TaxID=265554 RepID=A0A7S3L842_9STRA|mmetsp:Transcript_1830/g.3528  ORF Transcript_1830/g.3528 Transcript_1830/m.3528 type:complete len:354 (-) Transcript_1830:60-1121(-)